jgi:hypothetical protein
MSDMQSYGASSGSPQTPAGWYELQGELRYWDGAGWTEHRAALQPTQAYPVQAHPGQAYPGQAYPVVLSDARTNGVEMAFAWVFTVLSLGYFLPWAVAATRGKSNSWAIGLVNFLVGWTLIGWVVALVMACMAHQVAVVRR